MGWFTKLFHRCKHEYQIIDKTWICDTDISGNYWKVLRCKKCGKLRLGTLIPFSEEEKNIRVQSNPERI